MSKKLVGKIQRIASDLGLEAIEAEDMLCVHIKEELEPFMFIRIGGDLPKDTVGISVDLGFPDVHLVMVTTMALAKAFKVEPYEPVYWPKGSQEPVYGDQAYARWSAELSAFQMFDEATMGEDEKAH